MLLYLIALCGIFAYFSRQSGPPEELTEELTEELPEELPEPENIDPGKRPPRLRTIPELVWPVSTAPEEPTS
jgi:hypothetical protein